MELFGFAGGGGAYSFSPYPASAGEAFDPAASSSIFGAADAPIRYSWNRPTQLSYDGRQGFRRMMRMGMPSDGQRENGMLNGLEERQEILLQQQQQQRMDRQRRWEMQRLAAMRQQQHPNSFEEPMMRDMGGVQQQQQQQVQMQQQKMHNIQMDEGAGQQQLSDSPMNGDRDAVHGSDDVDAEPAATSQYGGEVEMARGLEGKQDRQEAAWLLRQGDAAKVLEARISHEMPLHKFERQLKDELASSKAEGKSAKELRRTAIAELKQYRTDMAKAEHDGQRQVEYLSAVKKYAGMARKEMSDAMSKKLASKKLVEESGEVVAAAHRAEVRARVSGDAQMLAAARGAIGKDLAEVRSAESDRAKAHSEEADAKYNTYMSKVLSSVLAQESKGTLQAGDIAKLGAGARQDMQKASAELESSSQKAAYAKLWLARASYQDAINKAVGSERRDSLKTLLDMREVEADKRAMKMELPRAVELREQGDELSRKAKLLEERAASIALPVH